MTSPETTHITSRDNPLLKELRKLSSEPTAYRKTGRVWLEGDHLCSAALARGIKPALAVFSESFMPLAGVFTASVAIKNIVNNNYKTVVISDKLWQDISGLESPAKMGFVVDLPSSVPILPQCRHRHFGPRARRWQCRLHPAQRRSVWV